MTTKINSANTAKMIPHHIMQFWDSIIPNDVQPLIDTWKQHCANWEYTVYNDEMAVSFLEDTYGANVREVYLKAVLPAMRSDIFRVGYCLEKGGVYVDVGTKCRQHVQTVLGTDPRLVVMQRPNGPIWNGFIACVAGEPRLADIWELILYNMRNKTSDNIWLATGPGAFSEVLRDYSGNDVRILPEEKLKSVFYKVTSQLSYRRSNHWSILQKKISIYND